MARNVSLLWLPIVRWTPVLLPLALLALMLALNPALHVPITWDRMSRNWTGEVLLAIVLTPIIITGGIDLSVGSIVGVSAVVAGVLWRGAGLPVELALAGSVVAGLICGAANGALILTGISPLIVTLATLGVFRGLAYGLSGRYGIDDLLFPIGMLDWWEGDFLFLPRPLWIILFVFAAGYVFLHHTWMGRMLYAIGDNPRAARFAAVPVRSLTFTTYALSGFVAGLAGLLSIFATQAAPSFQGEGMELTAIACVVLGGARITGGAGHMAGTFLGTLSLIILLEGVTRIQAEWRPLSTGLFLIAVAVANEGLARVRTWIEAEATR
jgi:rhamnose transport system permease protein